MPDTRVPAARTIKLVDTADEINVGTRTIIMHPGDSYTWAIDAAGKLGLELESVSGASVDDVGSPVGTLTIEESETQGGSVLLNLSLSEDAQDGDEWRVPFVIHPTEEQDVHAAVLVRAETD